MFAGLVSTEVRRFRARRAMRWLLGLGLLIGLVVNVVQLVRSEAATADTRASVFGEVPEQCRIGSLEGLPVLERNCAEQAGVGVGFFEGPVDESDTIAVFVRENDDRRVRVGRTLEDTIRGLGIALSLYGVLVGSTFLAAEFGASGLSTQLLFEPRRVTLYAAKAVAVFIGGAASAAIIVLWVLLLQLFASITRGSTAGVDPEWFLDRLADIGRAGAACGLAAVCALAIGSIARRTVVAVGVFFGLVVATGFLSNVSWGKPLARVSPMNALFAVGFGDLHDPDAFIGLRTLTGAVVVALVWALGLSVIGAAWFARREIR